LDKQYAVILSLTFAVILMLGILSWRDQLVAQVICSQNLAGEDSVEPAEGSERKTVNFLLLGSDSRETETGNTDSIMFITADLNCREVSIISIPRDTRVSIPGIGLTKINHANAIGGRENGPAAAVQAASELLGVPVNNYVLVNFQTFRSLVDTLGGIDIILPAPVNDQVQDIFLPAGLNHLDGEQALRLARVRYSLPDGDFGRQWYQYRILSSIADKILKKENISLLPQIWDSLCRELLQTNMTQAQTIALASKFTGFSSESIRYYQIPGKALIAHDPLVGADVYYFEADKTLLADVVQQAVGEVKLNLYGLNRL